MKTTFLTTTALLAVAGLANAEGMRPYIGIDYTRVMADYEDLAPGINGDQVLEDDLNGISPYVGVQLNDNIGVEVSYLQTEKGDKSNVLGTAVSTKTRIKGVSADVVGTLPVTEDNSFALLASAGVGRYEADVNASGLGLSGGGDEKDTGIRGGIGAQYQVTDAIGVRAMARYIAVDFDDVTDNLITGSVGLNYKF